MKTFCNQAHPEHIEVRRVASKNYAGFPAVVDRLFPQVTCSRFAHHDGTCAAYVFGISRGPEYWTSLESIVAGKRLQDITVEEYKTAMAGWPATGKKPHDG
jgi:hypothetical protein